MLIADSENAFFRNRMLSRMDPAAVRRLRLQLRRSPEIHQLTGTARADQILFIEDGYASLSVALTDGNQLAVGIVGNRLMLGATSLIGGQSNRMPFQTNTKGITKAYVCSLQDAQDEFKRMEVFHDLVLESLHIQLLQAMQLSACGAIHGVERRLSRWLLQCNDEVAGANIVASHEDLGDALGCCRTTITVAMDQLRHQGLLRYSRANIGVVDKPGLERHACECYAVIRNLYASKQGQGGFVPNGATPNTPQPAEQKQSSRQVA